MLHIIGPQPGKGSTGTFRDLKDLLAGETWEEAHESTQSPGYAARQLGEEIVD